MRLATSVLRSVIRRTTQPTKINKVQTR